METKTIAKGIIDGYVITVVQEKHYIRVFIEKITNGYKVWDGKFYNAWFYDYETWELHGKVKNILRTCLENVKKTPPDTLFPVPPKIEGYFPETNTVDIDGDRITIHARETTIEELARKIEQMI